MWNTIQKTSAKRATLVLGGKMRLESQCTRLKQSGRKNGTSENLNLIMTTINL